LCDEDEHFTLLTYWLEVRVPIRFHRFAFCNDSTAHRTSHCPPDASNPSFINDRHLHRIAKAYHCVKGAMAPTFVATAGGVVFDSNEAATISRKTEASQAVRNRLKHKLAEQRAAEVAAADHSYDQEVVDERGIAVVAETDEIALLEDKFRKDLLLRQAIRDQAEDNKLLARLAAEAKGNSKAIPSQYVYKPDTADNAAKRAVVHHTGSHYHMAGSKQFQRGVRVKGVISRHSKQGAKLQAARVAKNTGLAAREDARGERSSGAGKSQMKSTKKKKNRKTDG
jgi:hypothetical protein